MLLFKGKESQEVKTTATLEPYKERQKCPGQHAHGEPEFWKARWPSCSMVQACPWVKNEGNASDLCYFYTNTASPQHFPSNGWI